MKLLMVVLMGCGASSGETIAHADAAGREVAAQHEQHHVVKHNMVLFGSAETFASHIVYKQPHNYQVILKLSFASDVSTALAQARAANPSATFIYLLDAMHIADIASLDRITGTVLFRDDDGVSHPIFAGVTLTKDAFSIVYFDEVPLSLTSDPA